MSTQENFSDKNFSPDLIIQALILSPAPTAKYSGEDMVIHFTNDGSKY